MKMPFVAALSLVAAEEIELDYTCSDPPLGVAYDIEYYNGTVSCGNLLLECDIGGTHAWIPPTVTFPEAEDGAYYTVMYIDPWVDMPNNGSWPDVLTPGSKAAARHWVVGNIDAEMLTSGDFAGATTVSKYKGPSPPWGSHPYGQFLFKQSQGHEEFLVLPSPDGLYNWDYKAFISTYKLGMPVASNWHVTQHKDPRPERLPEKQVTREVSGFPQECSVPVLNVAYDIPYYSGKVSCGNLLLKSDIGGTHPWIEPTVTFSAAEDGSYYTLMYIDFWAFKDSWPDSTTPGATAPHRHWVVGNIDAQMITTGNLTGATTVSAYKGPSPSAGSHPYVQYLYKQTEGRQDNFPVLPSPDGIGDWDVDAFISTYKLSSKPIASNWHVTQQMDPREAVTTVV